MSAATQPKPAQETTTVDTPTVACNGGGGALGHPKVFLEISPKSGDVVCPYCSHHFVLDPNAKLAAAH